MTAMSAEPRELVSALAPSLIREIAEAGMSRDGLLPFWFGESDRRTPDFIQQAAIESIQRGETFYSQNLGRPYLRSALSRYLERLHDVEVSTDRLAIVSGGVSGLMLASQTIVSPGDKVVVVAPIWPNVGEIPRILGADVIRFPLVVRGGKWSLDLDALIQLLTPDIRMVVINSPNNPTGWTIKQDQIDAVLAHCRHLGIWILSDDVYQRVVYDPATNCSPSFLPCCEDGDRVISVNSFSKAWLMTGYRVGWIVAPPKVISNLAKIVEYNTSCIFEPAQRAAEAALERGEDTVREVKAQLGHKRELLARGLDAIDRVHLPEAGGGMYAFFSVDGAPDTVSLAKELVSKIGVGLAPGRAFGPEGQGWLRWCYAADDQKLVSAVDRLGRYLSKR